MKPKQLFMFPKEIGRPLKEVKLGQKKSKDYAEFLEKFKVKRSTDDCFTPPEVYDVVLNYVRHYCPQFEGKEIVRPFYPGGNYKEVDYDGCIVVDNPPFSILSEIIRFYNAWDIPYFLFAPHLTLFSTLRYGGTRIVACARIEYANGAKVPTSFVSNMFGDAMVIVDGNLATDIKKAQEKAKGATTISLPTYVYPEVVTSGALLGKLCVDGVRVSLGRDEVAPISRLEAQRQAGTRIFGGGILLGNSALLKVRQAQAQAPIIEWKLSEQEKEIIKSLR